MSESSIYLRANNPLSEIFFSDGEPSVVELFIASFLMIAYCVYLCGVMKKSTPVFNLAMTRVNLFIPEEKVDARQLVPVRATVHSEQFRAACRLLGLPVTASADEVHSRFRRLAFLYHPDRAVGDPLAAIRFQELNQARDTVLGRGNAVSRLSLEDDVQDWTIIADPVFRDAHDAVPVEIPGHIFVAPSLPDTSVNVIYVTIRNALPTISRTASPQSFIGSHQASGADSSSSLTRMFRQPVPALPAGYQTQNGFATEGRNDVPEEFICPLSRQVMDNPVELPSGQICEGAFIVEWLRRKPQNPFTRAPMDGNKLVPCTNLKARIDEYVAGAIPRLTR